MKEKLHEKTKAKAQQQPRGSGGVKGRAANCQVAVVQ